jgi:hypothetical protein
VALPPGLSTRECYDPVMIFCTLSEQVSLPDHGGIKRTGIELGHTRMTTKAVFLSYGSQDAEAASRIWVAVVATRF